VLRKLKNQVLHKLDSHLLGADLDQADHVGMRGQLLEQKSFAHEIFARAHSQFKHVHLLVHRIYLLVPLLQMSWLLPDDLLLPLFISLVKQFFRRVNFWIQFQSRLHLINRAILPLAHFAQD
jgi:hypothetical protein